MVTDLFISRQLKTHEKLFAGTAIFFPALMTILFFALGYHHQIPAFTWVVFAISVYLSIIGITLGFHRLLTHRGFTSNRYLKIILTCLGCTAFEGHPIFWVASHRRHHRFSDLPGDPHSPVLTDNKLWNFWHSHIGWMLNHDVENWKHYAKDMIKDKDLMFINHNYVTIATLGILIPTVINACYFGSWHAFWQGLFFCGYVRIFVIQQFTFGINSVTHLFGKQHFESNDKSRNNFLMGLIACGEGWHNNHHAFPMSAKHGLLWWQLDVTYLVLKLCALMGLASDIKLPSARQMEKKRLKQPR